ncbi:MAG: YihY/virulence factor BrkB family protein [Candidatus Acidiferrales bacterium]
MAMHRIVTNLARAFGRIFPDCVTLSQAIAFNMFLAFFPLLLLALGLLSGTSLFPEAIREIPNRLMQILPPGSARVVAEYFVRRTVNPVRWISLGLGGTLLAGTQTMVGFMEAFRVIEGELLEPSYWKRQARALGLLCLTIVPMLAVVVLTVFGKQLRAWLIQRTASPNFTHYVELIGYAAVVFSLAMGVLVLLYRIGRPGHVGYRDLLPGAAVATVLWWAVDISFGWYVRKMPYDVLYRGLASAIGLLLWMFLTAMIVLLGAAYNAEAREAREADARPSKLTLVVP